MHPDSVNQSSFDHEHDHEHDADFEDHENYLPEDSDEQLPMIRILPEANKNLSEDSLDDRPRSNKAIENGLIK